MLQRKILILSANPNSKTMLSDVLTDYILEFIMEPDLLKDVDSVMTNIQNNNHDILIITNYGIPSSYVFQYINLLPVERRYKAIMISGYNDESIQAVCAIKNIKFILIPWNYKDILEAIKTI